MQDTFAAYRASSGYGSEGRLLSALEKWGPNRFEVPIPKFTELLWDQLMAPFFCFQVGGGAWGGFDAKHERPNGRTAWR